MNQIVTQGHGKLMLLESMADKYRLSPEHFRATVRATCGLATATPEQVAAFLIVANQYGLNPVTREIYAFPGKGGGIVPIVSIDGWINLVNSHPACDGFEFEDVHGDDGKLVSVTCSMHRKDRKFPVKVTEYLAECRRATEPWKMEHRMLRHKALIQAARYAFGFAGVYDEDEGRTIAEAQDITPQVRVPVPSPSEVDAIEHHADTPIDEPERTVTADSNPPAKHDGPDIHESYDDWAKWAREQINAQTDGGALESWFNDHVESRRADIFPPDMAELSEVCGKRQTELGAES